MDPDKRCPVCESKNVSEYRDYNFSYDHGLYFLLRCDKCELIWTDPIPTNAALKSFYENEFSYDWYRDNLGNKMADAEERFIELKEELGSAVLDFGGGLGYFSKVCAKNGIQSALFDPYTSEDVPEGKYSAVVSNHSLEHCPDLDGTIERMMEFLAPEGRIVVSVPNSVGSCYRKFDMYSVWAQPPILHLFHFNLRNLEFLGLKHGCTLVRSFQSDRWDANWLADVQFRRLTNFLDSKWAKTKNRNLKKLVARLVGIYRLFCLKISRLFVETNNELTVIFKKA